MARLESIPLLIHEDQPLNEQCEAWIAASEEKLQTFWDRWLKHPIEQYVACDFRYVAAALQAIVDQDLSQGRMFCEWGCGFGIVAGLASILGFESIGIEAEPFLVREARTLLQNHGIAAEIWEGNFLPPGSASLAQNQSDHPSLGHRVRSAYEVNNTDLDDFALVFSYPWPGEAHFLREVFRRFARPDALLLMFLGPYEIELYRKLD